VRPERTAALAREAPPLDRRGRDWSLYSRNAICTYLIDGYAPAAVLLGVERKLSNGVVGLYSVAMGLGIVLGGLVATRLGALMSRDRESWLGVAASSVGIAVLTAGPDLVITLFGMALLGASVAVALSSVQSLIADRSGPQGLSESSGIGELFGMVAPFVVALGAIAGVTWRGGLLVVPVAGAATYLVARRRPARPEVRPAADADETGGFDRRSWTVWLSGVLLASAEFTIVLWLPDLLRLNAHAGAAVATALVSVLLAGMAAGRLLAGRIRLAGRLDRVLGWSVGIALAGFVVLWLTSSVPVAVLAVVVIGAAMSVHAPIALARLIAAADGAHRASARAASGQGLAMFTCPPLLGLLSDHWGIRWAVLVFPLILLAALGTIGAAPVDRA
jgi:MFS family permease